MDSFPLISLGDAIDSLTRRPALLLGPGATRAPDTFGPLLREAARFAKVDTAELTDDEQKYGEIIDQVRANFPAKAAVFEATVKDRLIAIKPSLDLPHLAKAMWSACISLTEDMTFEGVLRTHLESIPGTRSLTVVDNSSVIPPNRTIPVYKLLGNILDPMPDSTLVLSESELLLRQQDWRNILRTLPDHLRDGPIFIVGCNPKIGLLKQVIGLLNSLSHPRPTKLLFLKDDLCLRDATLVSLCRRFSTSIVDASLRELAAQVSALRESLGTQALISVPASKSTLEQLIKKHSTLISYLPSHLTGKLSSMELPHAVEGLFRPAANDWRAFQHRLDLRRAVTDKVEKEIGSLLLDSATGRFRVLIVHGEAGTGKTTILKRVAMDSAEAGLVSLWCTRSVGGGTPRAFNELSKELAEWGKRPENSGRQFVLFADDPWGLRLGVGELVSAFETFPHPLVIIFTVRNTEFGTTDARSIRGLVPINAEVEVPFELEPSELELLADTLVSIGASSDITSAKREIRRIPSKHANDILCSMWYLIPETRLQLAESLRDEYCRLGNIREAISSLAAQSISESSVAHGAYELVTVTSSLDIGLPVEVLVAALQIDYSEWFDNIGTGRPLWGLLYDSTDPDNDTIAYYTRNEVVTRVLLELVNGPIGHAGEFGALKKLLAACSGGSIVYRNFVASILIRARKKLANFLTYDQGLELYAIARAALPFEDRVIEHHLGIWMQDVGDRKETEAYRQFEKALGAEVYPGSDRDAPKEHIHTSMAAAVVKLIRSGEQDPATGATLVTEHLRQASSSRFFNPHTSHVSATLLFDLSKFDGIVGNQSESFGYIVSALQEIERARQVVGQQVQVHMRHIKDLEMMTDLESRILGGIPNSETLRHLSLEMFMRNRSQAGFEITARRLFTEATRSSKGKDYNLVNEYLNECMTLLDEKLIQPSTNLLLIRVDLMVRWTIQRFTAVPWEPFRDDLIDILKDNKYRDDVMRNFFYAVSLYHLGAVPEANAIFANLRRWQPVAYGLRDIRCFYLNADGSPRRFQGTYKREHERTFFEIPELNVSLLSRSVPGFGSGATAHAYVAFALQGPLAQADKPSPNDITV